MKINASIYTSLPNSPCSNANENTWTVAELRSQSDIENGKKIEIKIAAQANKYTTRLFRANRFINKMNSIIRWRFQESFICTAPNIYERTDSRFIDGNSL